MLYSRYQLDRRLDGSQSRSEHGSRIRIPRRDSTPTINPAASYYTDSSYSRILPYLLGLQTINETKTTYHIFSEELVSEFYSILIYEVPTNSGILS
jgi:hypothetical protein